MRYWLFLLGKLAAAAGVSYGTLLALQAFWPAQQRFIYVYPPRFGHDLWYTLAILLWFLFTWGLLYLCIWDQRYRCRVCLRRLRMPIVTGSWGRMLQLGRPEIEYICTYGHGRLNVSEVQISGTEPAEWTPRSDNLWEELAASASKDESDR